MKFELLFTDHADEQMSTLEKSKEKYGWWFERHGGSHDIWTNGEFRIPVPRHREVNERTAKSILKKAEANKI